MSAPHLLPVPDPEAPAAPATYVLAMHGISKRWGPLQVLDDVDLELEAGRLTWIGGANGVGKTTLLRIAAGLIGADRGFVRLHERLHPERNRREFLAHVGYLSAGNGALYARLTPRQHVDLAARLAMIPRARRAQAVADALQRYNLEPFAGRRVDRLSTGQRQRVRLAVALVHRPELLLLDEPFNSLDEEGIALFCGVISDALLRGGAALVCSPGALALPVPFDEHYRLEQGKLLAA